MARLQRHLAPDHPLLELINYYNDSSTGPAFVASLLYKRPEAMQCYYGYSEGAIRRQLLPHFKRNKATYQQGTWLTILDLNGRILWKTSVPITLALTENGQSQRSSNTTSLLITTITRSHIANVGNIHNKGPRTRDLFDDPRLFVLDGQMWISYNDDNITQSHNPLHFESTSGESHNATPTPRGTLSVFLQNRETISSCCGRNLGVLEQKENHQDSVSPNQHLQSRLSLLAWVDPVTVVHVGGSSNVSTDASTSYQNATQNDKPQVQEDNKQALTMEHITSWDDQVTASMVAESKNFGFHGTNGFLLYLSDSDEYLGVGHFHKGRDRPFGVWGHHYTHAFYTISAAGKKPWEKQQRRQYRMTGLSPEFIFPSKSARPEHQLDGDVIQFASGLELVHHMDEDFVVIAYGINDCESALLWVELGRVRELLQPVNSSGNFQMADLMKLA